MMTVRSVRPRHLAALAFIALMGCFAAPASAQVSNLDDARFLRGLRERGLQDLLLYFIEKNPPKDPIARLEIEVEVAKGLADNPKADLDKRRDAFDKVRAAYKKLLQAAPFDHAKRPIWEIEMTLYDYEVLLRSWRHSNAADFVEFGVPNQEMRNIFNQVAPEDAMTMEDAILDMFDVIGALPRDRDFQQKYVNNGFWTELTEVYNELMLPYYRALALRYAALLDEKVQKDIGDRANRKFAELLQEADTGLERLGKKNLDPGTKGKILCLHARLKIARKRYQEAVALCDQAIAVKEIAPFEKLLAMLAKSQALEGLKKPDEAMKAIDEARKFVKDPKSPAHGLMNLILVYARQRAMTGDDNVWTALLNDDMVTADPQLKGAVQDFVNKMILGDQVDVAKLGDDDTPQKIMAAVDKLLAQAQPHLDEAGKATDAKEKNAHLKEAAGFLDPAAGLLKKLVAREKIEPGARGQALFKLGIVEYKRGNRYEAAVAWVDLAANHSDQSEAEGAAKNAVTVAKDLYDNLPGADKDPKFIKLMTDALVALITRFPHTAEAKLHAYTLGVVYRKNGEFEKAIEAFKTVAPDHPFYADAVYEMGVCLYDLMLRAADAAELAARAGQAKIGLAAAQAAIKQALAKPGADAERAKSLRYKLGDATVRAAEAMVTLNQNGEASTALRDFDKDFGEFPDLVKAARIVNISVLLNLNNAAQAVEEVKKLVAQFPAEGGPLINRVLALLNERIANLVILNKDAEAMKLAADAVDMAKSLLEWAKTQDNLRGNLVPFRLIVARQLVIAREFEAAEAIFAELEAAPGGDKDQDILFGHAEALYMLAASGKLEGEKLEVTEVQALKGLDKIITLTAEPKQDSPTWWRAWTIRLQIMDQRLNRARTAGDDERVKSVAGDIYRAIARLELLDKELGLRFDRRISDVLNKLKGKAWLIISK